MPLFDFVVWGLLSIVLICVVVMTYPYMLNAPALIVFSWSGALGSSVLLIIGSVHNWLFNRRYDRYYKW